MAIPGHEPGSTLDSRPKPPTPTELWLDRAGMLLLVATGGNMTLNLISTSIGYKGVSIVLVAGVVLVAVARLRRHVPATSPLGRRLPRVLLWTALLAAVPAAVGSPTWTAAWTVTAAAFVAVASLLAGRQAWIMLFGAAVLGVSVAVTSAGVAMLGKGAVLGGVVALFCAVAMAGAGVMLLLLRRTTLYDETGASLLEPPPIGANGRFSGPPRARLIGQNDAPVELRWKGKIGHALGGELLYKGLNIAIVGLLFSVAVPTLGIAMISLGVVMAVLGVVPERGEYTPLGVTLLGVGIATAAAEVIAMLNRVTLLRTALLGASIATASAGVALLRWLGWGPRVQRTWTRWTTSVPDQKTSTSPEPDLTDDGAAAP